jgi:glucoamylase
VLYQLSYLAGRAKASVRAVRGIVAAGAALLVAGSVSGAAEQPPPPIQTAMPAPHFGSPRSGPFSPAAVRREVRPLGSRAPIWARRLYRRSVRVLVALTDPRNGAMIAGERDGWDYVWPRDASAGAIALEAAGLRPEARRVAHFLGSLDLDDGARFYPDGAAVPGRPPAGDGEGWVGAAERAARHRSTDGTVLPSGRLATTSQDGPGDWRDRQDYGENVSGDLLGNAIAAGAPPAEITSRFIRPSGLVRQEGGDEVDSSAAWAATIFPTRGLRGAVRQTLLEFTRDSTAFGIPPIEGWTPGQVWTAPTAWSAWALAKLGDTGAADRLLEELRRAATPSATLPERVDARTGRPTSTTPLAWSHAFAILALRARYGG